MKKSIILTLGCCLALLTACTNPSEKIEGAWKSQDLDRLSGKPKCFVFTKDDVFTDGNSMRVTYSEEKGMILVRQVGSDYVNFRIMPQQNPDEMEIGSQMGGKQIFIRTTHEDVKAIRAMPSQLKSKPDPF